MRHFIADFDQRIANIVTEVQQAVQAGGAGAAAN
jgi:hypothetical protein